MQVKLLCSHLIQLLNFAVYPSTVALIPLSFLTFALRRANFRRGANSFMAIRRRF